MSYENCGPVRSSHRPAPKIESQPPSCCAPTAVQEPRVPSEEERRLVAAGWRWPSQLARDADQLGLHDSDFDDRLCSVVVAYLRECGEKEHSPTRAGAEAWLAHFAVPHNPEELGSILTDTFVPDGDTLADLVDDVIRESQQRSGELFRELARDGLRTLHHAFNCQRCIRCANGEHERSREVTRLRPYRRVVYAK